MKRYRAGNSLIEFALVGMVLIPLFLGTTNVGLILGRSVQVQQLARDSGHMLARQVDFTLSGNQKLLVRLGQNLGLRQGTGPGVVILSKILLAGQDQCAGAGLAGSCPNQDKAVFIHRVAVGNPAIHQSEFGTPGPAMINSAGNILPSDYLVDPSAVASNFSPQTLKGMVPGEIAYLAEVYFEFPEWFLNQSYTRKSVSARSIY
jgi:hypothetical protein